jgi:hypothetical protein
LSFLKLTRKPYCKKKDEIVKLVADEVSGSKLKYGERGK